MIDRIEAHRLGKRELGRHAFESRMPTRIARILLSEDSSNKLSGVVPLIARILEKSQDIDVAYLCSSTSIQIWRLQCEGGFCGYRNIQMLVEELQSKKVPEIQDMIEDAWDLGHNAHGRVETGGIKGTRKNIGTSEAQALLDSLGVLCKGDAFIGKDAYKVLLDSVEGYFTSSRSSDVPSSINQREIVQTDLPPIYLQMPQHSITIIGIERLSNGKRGLLVFDPGRPAPFAYRKAVASGKLPLWPEFLLGWTYRRSETNLKRRKRFETLRITEKNSK